VEEDEVEEAERVRSANLAAGAAVGADAGRRGGNHDGIVLAQYPHLVEYLNTKGIPVQLNDRGWLDWPPY
jgi:hypothetical protein